MITVHRRLERQWIKLDEDDDAEFEIRPLSSAEMIDVENELSARDGIIRISGRGLIAACRGLVNWRRVVDESGKELAFSQRHVEWLPPDTLQQLAVKIYKASKLTDDERKNS